MIEIDFLENGYSIKVTENIENGVANAAVRTLHANDTVTLRPKTRSEIFERNFNLEISKYKRFASKYEAKAKYAWIGKEKGQYIAVIDRK